MAFAKAGIVDSSAVTTIGIPAFRNASEVTGPMLAARTCGMSASRRSAGRALTKFVTVEELLKVTRSTSSRSIRSRIPSGSVSSGSVRYADTSMTFAPRLRKPSASSARAISDRGRRYV